MRADQLLVQRGLAASRSQAQRLIGSGVRWFDGAGWQAVAKCGQVLPLQAPIDLGDAAERRYVSRGGLKLEGALKSAGLDVAGASCLDLGQSTGGFTDCLLRHGAARVVGVDVGHGQLAPALRADPRVACIERLNARDAEALRSALAGLPGAAFARLGQTGFDLVVGDLSFISQTLVLPAVVPLLCPGGHLLMLVKPQFELQPGQLGKGGIVRDASLHEVVRSRIAACCAELGLGLAGWHDSPIAGGDGNREYFVFASAPAAQA
jgi:23S rRNA (cytidine1920-2'-O)/16S rRNA (cytidine1409-2'-O)-methyltransferase